MSRARRWIDAPGDLTDAGPRRAPAFAVQRDARRGRFRVQNRRWFTDLSDLRGTWTLLVDGEPVAEGALPVFRTAPQAREDFNVRYPALALPSGAEAHVTFRFFTRKATPWCAAGHEMAWQQHAVPSGAFRRSRPIKPSAVSGVPEVAETAGGWTVSAGGLSFEVDRASGVLANFRRDDRLLITCGPQLNVWRAATDNDGLKLFTEVLGFYLVERVLTPDGNGNAAIWLSCGQKVHDIAFAEYPEPGKLHHCSFLMESWEQVLRAGDIMSMSAVPVDIGPTRHGVTRGCTIYAWDPSGNRFETFCGGHLPYPDYETMTWTFDNFGQGLDYPQRKLHETFLSVVS